MAQQRDLHTCSAEDNEYFKRVLDLIPAQFYFDEESKEQLRRKPSDKGKANQSNAPGGKGLKRKLDNLSVKAQTKWQKFDPNQPVTVTKLQEKLIEEENREKERQSKVKKPGKPAVSVTEDDSSLNLREKLHQKIEAMKAKRNALGKEDWIEKKRLLRRMSKMKMKMKKDFQKHGKGPLLDGGAGRDKTPKKLPPGTKPIYNSEGKMVFSKFDFSESGKTKKSQEASGKDFKKLLEKATKQKQKIEDLKGKDLEAGKNLETKLQWKKAQQKAEGVKVRDDPELLKKAAKRKEKAKEKRKKNWEEREQKVKGRMQAQQDKRKKNIQKKKQGRIDKKIKKARKKGRMVPGF